MAKRETFDPAILTGDALIKHLVNTVEVMTKDAVNSVNKLKTDIVGEINERFETIAPICDQFPGLCTAVDQLKDSQAAAGQTKPREAYEVADALAQHYKECDDPSCRRAIRARMAAVGLATPPETDEHQHHIDEQVKDDSPVDPGPPPAPEATPELQPWEHLRVSESKYRRHKSYYDDVIANGG